MKKLIPLVILLFGTICNAQKISFDFDSAVNQILRQWCTNCNDKNSGETLKEIADLKQEDLQKFYPEDVISYYPNPVKEQLYLKWDVINNNYVVSIELYNLSGQIIKSYKKLNGSNSYTISFSELPRNVYSLNLIYANGEQKSIKIIKE